MTGIVIGRALEGRTMIEILNRTELARARETGALVADILRTMQGRATVGTNLLEIDRWTKGMIADAGAESCYVDYAPSFGRGPFGHYICTSVNDAVLHGKPHDYVLADGDLLTLDLAVSLGGVVADSAVSFVVGKTQPAESLALIDTTERALAAGIDAAGPGARIGDLSHAIGTVLTGAGYTVNTEFGGHGVGSTMHQDPHIANAPAGPAARARAVGHGRHRRARHRRRRLDPAQRHRRADGAQRAHGRHHRGRRRGADPALTHVRARAPRRGRRVHVLVGRRGSGSATPDGRLASGPWGS
jgi:methionyl aminopeptidase